MRDREKMRVRGNESVWERERVFVCEREKESETVTQREREREEEVASSRFRDIER